VPTLGLRRIELIAAVLLQLPALNSTTLLAAVLSTDAERPVKDFSNVVLA
jgi:hypothetical protein